MTFMLYKYHINLEKNLFIKITMILQQYLLKKSFKSNSRFMHQMFSIFFEINQTILCVLIHLNKVSILQPNHLIYLRVWEICRTFVVPIAE